MLVKKAHLELLKKLKFTWTDFELGAPQIDYKHPFGGGGIVQEIAKIVGIELCSPSQDPDKYERQAANISLGYQELQYCLEILCQDLTISPGEYIFIEGEWVKLC